MNCRRRGGYADVGPAEKFFGTQKDVANIIAVLFRKAGASEEGLAGLLANATSESALRPGVKGGFGEIGLWQFLGNEERRYIDWVKKNYPGGNWADRKLQAEYMPLNLKEHYPELWKELQSHTPAGQQAADFVSKYEHPARIYEEQRRNKYLRGVSPVEHYTGGPQSMNDMRVFQRDQKIAMTINNAAGANYAVHGAMLGSGSGNYGSHG